MKKIICLLAVVFSVHASPFAQTYTFESLVGSWRNKEGVGLEVRDSSKLFIVHGEAKKQILSYNIDFTTNPAKFNFVIKDGAGIANVKSMLLFVADDLLQWQVFEEDAKPAGFKESSFRESNHHDYGSKRTDLLILRRIDQKNN